MKEPTVFQKELRLNLSGPEPNRGGERTTLTLKGKKAREEKPTGRLVHQRRERRRATERGGLGSERNRGRAREREG